jgi:small conductance mechanosensitive channel
MMWQNFFSALFKVIVIVVVSQVLLRIIQKTVTPMIDKQQSNRFIHIDERRSKTVARLVNNIISYVIYFIMALMILNQFGIQIGPLLAGAGVVGLAIGFGAQSLVKDIITGFFIIFEDQFGVGDVIQIGTLKGTVEEIGLRVTKISSATGERHIIPNGTILQVTNFSVHNSVSVVDIPIDTQTDVELAILTIKEAVQTFAAQHPDFPSPPEVLGVQTITGGEMMIRISIVTKPNTQFQLLRQLNEIIKKSLDDKGISLSSGVKR